MAASLLDLSIILQPAAVRAKVATVLFAWPFWCGCRSLAVRSDPMCPCMWRRGLRSIGHFDGHCIIASSPANSSGLKSTSIKVRFCIVLKYMYQLLPGTCSRRQININSSTLCFYGLRYVDAFVANTLIEARSLMLQCCGRALAEG